MAFPLLTTSFLKIGKLYKKGVFIGIYSNEGTFSVVVVAVWGKVWDRCGQVWGI